MINNKGVVKKVSKKLLLNLAVTYSISCVRKKKKGNITVWSTSQLFKRWRKIFTWALHWVSFTSTSLYTHTRPSCVLFKFKAKIGLLSNQLEETWTLSVSRSRTDFPQDSLKASFVWAEPSHLAGAHFCWLQDPHPGHEYSWCYSCCVPYPLMSLTPSTRETLQSSCRAFDSSY